MWNDRRMGVLELFVYPSLTLERAGYCLPLLRSCRATTPDAVGAELMHDTGQEMH